MEVLKMIAVNHGYELLAARVHNGGHVHLFVSSPPKASIPVMVSVFMCVSVKLLFEEFSEIKLRHWGGHLWSEDYSVRTAAL